MDTQRIRKLIAISINAIIVILIIIYLALTLNSVGVGTLGNTGWGMLKYYTNLSNFLGAIVALILLPYEIISFIKKKDILPLWALLLKYAAVIALMITFLITAGFLGPVNVSNGGSYWSLFAGVNMIVHFFVPILALISFCFFETSPEIKFPFTLVGLSTVVLYAFFYVTNFYAHLIPGDGIQGQSRYDWYGFFQNNSVPVSILIIIVILAFAYGVSVLVWFINKKCRTKFGKDS